MKIQRNTFRIRTLFVLLVILSNFVSCDKSDLPSPEEALYQRFLQSDEYVFLSGNNPNFKIEKWEIVEVNTWIKALITYFESSSHEIISAISYNDVRLPDKFTTILFSATSEVSPINVITENSQFQGEIKISTISNRLLAHFTSDGRDFTSVLNPQRQNTIDKIDLKSVSQNEHLVANVESDLGDCLDAASACVTTTINDMGWFETAACMVSFPACYGVILGDCILHEKDCLGVPKPSELFQ